MLLNKSQTPQLPQTAVTSSPYRILNLYAGIGGNRQLWGDEYDITAVELDVNIAKVYSNLYPNDKLIVGDAHEYLIKNYMNFDFIWSSPPCPTHSRLCFSKKTKEYIDMKLYQEIVLLKSWFKGKYVVENVIPYYEPLISPNVILGRHPFWTNFKIQEKEFTNILPIWTDKRNFFYFYFLIKKIYLFLLKHLKLYIMTKLEKIAGIENNRDWIKIESENWLKEKKISGSITKFFVDNPDEDYLSIAVIVSNGKDDEMLLLNDYLFVKKDLESIGIFATHYQPIVKPQPPIF
jgi:DNA (cytosine-5)-methyltransferase 1